MTFQLNTVLHSRSFVPSSNMFSLSGLTYHPPWRTGRSKFEEKNRNWNVFLCWDIYVFPISFHISGQVTNLTERTGVIQRKQRVWCLVFPLSSPTKVFMLGFTTIGQQQPLFAFTLQSSRIATTFINYQLRSIYTTDTIQATNKQTNAKCRGSSGHSHSRQILKKKLWKILWKTRKYTKKKTVSGGQITFSNYGSQWFLRFDKYGFNMKTCIYIWYWHQM